MTEREKVISDVISAFDEWENNMCCPGEDWSDVHESRDMVIALLKAQEPVEPEPTAPVIYRTIDWYEDEVLGAQESAEVYEDWPENGGLFEIEGCGMGCCVIRVGMLPEVVAAFRISPFTPQPRLSEDLSFCWRLKKLRKRMVCDPGILPGHAGLMVYRRQDWDRQREVQE